MCAVRKIETWLHWILGAVRIVWLTTEADGLFVGRVYGKLWMQYYIAVYVCVLSTGTVHCVISTSCRVVVDTCKVCVCFWVGHYLCVCVRVCLCLSVGLCVSLSVFVQYFYMYVFVDLARCSVRPAQVVVWTPVRAAGRVTVSGVVSHVTRQLSS